MDWNLAIERNHPALKRVLAMLVAMAGMTSDGSKQGSGARPATLPRHLHRFILSLLRPAESATRRLIIIAARGLAVKLPKPRTTTDEPRPVRPDPRAIPDWARLRLQHGLPIEFPRGEPIPLWARETTERGESAPVPHAPFFPMFDPMKRFDRKPARRRIPEDRMPSITLLNDAGWSVPLHLRRAPPPPPAPTPDDPLDAGNIHRRLGMIGAALDDLPRQALRFARWKARRDARLARERSETEQSQSAEAPSPSRPSGSRGGEPEGRDGEGAFSTRGNPAYYMEGNAVTQTVKPRRFRRLSPMRPGRPPGWRKKPAHEIHEILNDLHGLAVWARDGP